MTETCGEIAACDCAVTGRVNLTFVNLTRVYESIFLPGLFPDAAAFLYQVSY